MTRTLIIDGQLLQTLAWARGMGRYSLCLLKSVHGRFPYDKVILLLNENLELSEGAAAAIAEALPGISRKSINLRLPKPNKIPEVHRHNKRVMNEFVRTECKGESVAFLQLGPFQADYYPVFPDAAQKFMVFYDFIPYQYPKIYNPTAEYLYRFNSLFETDHFFAISETVKADLINVLAIDAEKITNLDGGPTLDYDTVIKDKKTSFELPEKYILAPSGNDYRKNNVRAVQAFERFRQASGKDYKMILTSHFFDEQIVQLQQYSSNLIFTGIVDDATLYTLFNEADMLLFASEYEGLGLPILESAVFGKRIACSSISAFKEISEEAFYFFDPIDIESMVRALLSAQRGDDWKDKKKHYAGIIKKYTWEAAAARFVGQLAKEKVAAEIDQVKKIAVLAPRLDDDLGVTSAINSLHTLLEPHRIDYFTEPIGADENEFRRASYLEHTLRSYDISEFNRQKYKEYDAVLYHLTDTDHNSAVLKFALSLPGTVFVYSDRLERLWHNMVERECITPERLRLEENIASSLHLKEGVLLGSLLNNNHLVINALGGDCAARSFKKGVPAVKLASKLESFAPLFAHAAPAKPQVGQRHYAIYWDPGYSRQEQQDFYQFVHRFAQDDAFDVARLSILTIGLPDEALLALGDEYVNISTLGATTEFELESVFENVDVMIDFAAHATVHALAVIAMAVNQGCRIVSRNTTKQLPAGVAVQYVTGFEQLFEGMLQPLEAKPTITPDSRLQLQQLLFGKGGK